jgi:pyridoxamine 5'-phosphate oxidase
MRHNPIDVFIDYYTKELALIPAKIPSACCLSTLGTDGYPEAFLRNNYAQNN